MSGPAAAIGMSGEDECIRVLDDPLDNKLIGEHEGGFQPEKRQRVHGGGRRKADDWQHVTVAMSQSSDGFGKVKFTVVCKCGHKIGIYSQKPKVEIPYRNIQLDSKLIVD